MILLLVMLVANSGVYWLEVMNQAPFLSIHPTLQTVPLRLLLRARNFVLHFFLHIPSSLQRHSLRRNPQFHEIRSWHNWVKTQLTQTTVLKLCWFTPAWGKGTIIFLSFDWVATVTRDWIDDKIKQIMNLEHAAGISPVDLQCETSKKRPVKYELM